MTEDGAAGHLAMAVEVNTFPSPLATQSTAFASTLNSMSH